MHAIHYTNISCSTFSTLERNIYKKNSFICLALFLGISGKFSQGIHTDGLKVFWNKEN